MPGGQQVLYESLGAEVFAGLDQGKSANPQLVLGSLGSASAPYKTMSTNSKSGEFFFFSNDRRFLVKTITEAEALLLFSMLPAYQYHLETHPDSLIVRYAGLFAVQVPGIGLIYFTVMASVFDPNYCIWLTFDIKGSMHGRKRKDHETIGKDWDWVKGSFHLDIVEDARQRFCATHEQDVRFLARFKCMDYSLLIGFHKPKGDNDERPICRKWYGIGGGLQACEGTPMVYYVGLIDFLISYTFKKKAEHIKLTAQGVGDTASCVDPESYAVRQVRFVRDQVVAKPDDAEHKGVCGTVGLLKVQIIAATALRNADLRSHGLSDPYVKARLGLQELRTRTINNSLDPEWNETLWFSVDDAHKNDELKLTLWDEDAGVTQGRDDFLGDCSVSMEEVFSMEDAIPETRNSEDKPVESKSIDYTKVLQNSSEWSTPNPITGSLTFALDYRPQPEGQDGPEEKHKRVENL